MTENLNFVGELVDLVQAGQLSRNKAHTIAKRRGLGREFHHRSKGEPVPPLPPRSRPRWEPKDLMAALTARLKREGWSHIDTSDSGSVYMKRGKQMLRVSDHDPNPATQEWMEFQKVHEVRLDHGRWPKDISVGDLGYPDIFDTEESNICDLLDDADAHPEAWDDADLAQLHEVAKRPSGYGCTGAERLWIQKALIARELGG